MTAQYLETSALLALLEGDESKAQEMIKGMLPYERAELRQAASTLAELLDPRSWCGGCNGYIATNQKLAEFYKQGYRWHHACWLNSMNNHALVEKAF